MDFDYGLDWFGFYRGIDKADDGLDELSSSLRHIFSEADHLNYVFRELTRDAAKIKDEDKREKFETVLSYFPYCLYEISEKCYEMSAEIDKVREFGLSELVVESEEMAKEKKKAAN